MRFVAAACAIALLPWFAGRAEARDDRPRAGGAQAGASRYAGRPVTAVQVVVEGAPAADAELAELVQTKVGAPLSMAEVRDSIAHLFSLSRFEDVRVEAEEAGGGVALRYNLIPVHGVERVTFTGDLGVSEGLLRRTVSERVGPRLPAGRVQEAVRGLLQLYEDRGYRRASIVPRTTRLHDPDRTILVFEISAGPRARIGRVEITGEPLASGPALLARLRATPGSFYEQAEIQRRLADYVGGLKDKGRYDAVASLRLGALSDDGTLADLTLDIRPGPIITLAFEGDPIPRERWDELVPIEEQGSAAEDLLEDSTRRIEDYLKAQGFWRARVGFERRPAGDRMTIVFTVRRGLQYRVAAGGVEIRGNQALPPEQLRPLAPRLGAGDLYLESNLAAAVSAIAAHYLKQGYAQVRVSGSETELNPQGPGEGQVRPVIAIAEGPLTLVGAISFTGNATVSEQELRSVIRSETGATYHQEVAAGDEDSVLLHYYNLGFASASVQLAPQRSADGSRIDLEFRIGEGPRTLVDHVIIVGNRRTDPDIIRRELQLRPGAPLGLSDRMESQRRLGALGLFRRVSVQPLSHGDDKRMDVLVTVEEAAATSVGYGGGVEASRLLRPTGPGGEAEERFELAPRGFFEIGRRNLGGKNRSVNLFTRFGLRPDDSLDDPGGSPFGFVDYRVIGTYRQPRLLGPNELTVTGAVEQGVRSSFNFARRGVTSEVTRRLAPGVRAAVRYSFSRTKTFDKGVGEEDQAFIDRLFPQVQLSSFSGALSRDTRDSVVEPSRGAFLSAEGSVAARALGGQVGFMKTYLQAFWFHRVPGAGDVVFATRAALGVADGFERTVQATDSTGAPIPGESVVIEDLPASERFYAGGDTTIRGFALDTVGTPETISPSGFPKGGNAVVILNAELRLPVWREIGAVVFLDGGNVFALATDFTLGELRGAAGFGLRYRSPVGPIRLDFGFKMDRRVRGDQLEPRGEFHLSIGHAF
jgi:outer membrane protein assembly factor BamA